MACIGFLALTGFLHVWITQGKSTFLKGISKRSLSEVCKVINEAKKNGDDYQGIIKRAIVGYGIMIAFVITCFALAFVL
jgi:uncharacterized protein YaaQ